MQEAGCEIGRRVQVRRGRLVLELEPRLRRTGRGATM